MQEFCQCGPAPALADTEREGGGEKLAANVQQIENRLHGVSV